VLSDSYDLRHLFRIYYIYVHKLDAQGINIKWPKARLAMGPAVIGATQCINVKWRVWPRARLAMGPAVVGAA